MIRVKKGTKRKPMWKAECRECGSKFKEEAGKLRIEDDRDGQLARSRCPDCHSEMFFYPPAASNR